MPPPRSLPAAQSGGEGAGALECHVALSSIDAFTNGTRPLGSINRKNSSEVQDLLQTAKQLRQMFARVSPTNGNATR